MSLTEADLNRMSEDAIVKDCDGDIWVKDVDGYWTYAQGGGSYLRWTAEKLIDQQEPITLDMKIPTRSEVETRIHLRTEVLSAENAWLGEGYDNDLFEKGVERGWFTDKFFTDLAEGEAF